MHLNWGDLHGTLRREIEYSLRSKLYRKVESEHAEVSSSRSTRETYENRWRKGLDGWNKTDAIYLIL